MVSGSFDIYELVGEAAISVNWSGKGRSWYQQSDKGWSGKRRSAENCFFSIKITQGLFETDFNIAVITAEKQGKIKDKHLYLQAALQKLPDMKWL